MRRAAAAQDSPAWTTPLSSRPRSRTVRCVGHPREVSDSSGTSARPELVPDHAERQAGGVALAGQHPDQPPGRGGRRRGRAGCAASGAPGPAPRPPGSSRVELVERLAATSSSTPLRRSSWASARRASPLPGCAARPRPGRRRRRRPARPPRTGRAAGPRPRRALLAASLSASSAAARARPVSWSSRILRATASGSASGPRRPGRRRSGAAAGGRPHAPGPGVDPERRRRPARRSAIGCRDSEVIDTDRLVRQVVGGGRWSTCGPTPSFSRIFFSSSLARSGLSRRKVRAFSLPWPSWSPS